MNTLFMTLAYHPEEIKTVAKYSRDGLQNQIDAYQWAFIEGLQKNLGKGETLTILNALPVGVYPLHYRKLWLARKQFGSNFTQIASLNLPWCKQKMRALFAKRALLRWIRSSPDNRGILLYSLYLPFMQAVQEVKKQYPDVKASIIITDLPNELGIASGRTGFLKRIEYKIGTRRIALCNAFDGFILLTEPMKEALPVGEKPWMVLEGLISQENIPSVSISLPQDARPAVLYTGTLNRELGINILLDAFNKLKDVQLWLCGKGDMQNEVEQAAITNDNIHYFGLVSRAEAMTLQSNATALINPRTAQGVFTRYSFPSKTMEYMKSGRPVLCCKLEGIPDEYDAYVRYIQPQTADGIRHAVVELLALPQEQLASIGQKARAFVLTNKNSTVQCAKLLKFMHSL